MTAPLSIVVWMWNDDTIARTFLPGHVNVLREMLARHSSVRFELVCVSDSAEGLDVRVRHVPTPGAVGPIAEMKSLEGQRFPSCYRRLWGFSAEAAPALGPRVLLLDIDLLVMRDIKPLVDYCEGAEFVGWRPLRDWGQKVRFGGGIYYMETGKRRHVWDDFIRDPERAARTARNAGYRGSDQAWISYNLADRERCWPQFGGIYSVRDFKHTTKGPGDAIIIQMNGPEKPWESDKGFARENWR